MTETASTSNEAARRGEPVVSVIVPAHNEEDFIARCLASLRDLDWPADRLEILVVDHQSSDSTAAIARSAGASVLHHGPGKIGSVRNAGLKLARGEFVAYVDADCIVPRTWLRTAIALLDSATGVGAVGGPCLAPGTGTWVEQGLAATGASPGAVATANTLATSSFIARTSLLRDLGLFDESLMSGEDDDMSVRIRRRGLILKSASDCHIVHYGFPRTWSSLVGKERWHGCNHLEVRSGLDITLILTHLFLLASVALPLLAIAAPLWPTPEIMFGLLGAVAAQFILPLLYALKRLRAYPADWRLIGHFVVVGYGYFVGRALGLIENYRRRLGGRLLR